MASITKRNGRWFVQVRKTGFPSRSATFSTRAEARHWSIEIESDYKRRVDPPSKDVPQGLRLRDLIKRYREQVTVKKRGAEYEDYRLQKIARSDFAATPLSNLSANAIADYRDARLRDVAPATVHKELSLLQTIVKRAINEWAVAIVANPFDKVSRPRFNNARERRLDVAELQKLRHSLDTCRNALLVPVFEFAIETGMRRGEILALEWQEVHLFKRTARLPRTKNGHPRTVPLSPKAVAILERLIDVRDLKEARVFPITVNALKQAWVRAIARSGLIDLHFHDLRHEAISRFFEHGLSMPEVALISGHRDPRMLFRYTHLSAVDIARKLSGLRVEG